MNPFRAGFSPLSFIAWGFIPRRIRAAMHRWIHRGIRAAMHRPIGAGIRRMHRPIRTGIRRMHRPIRTGINPRATNESPLKGAQT